MNTTIYKYTVPITDEVVMSLPIGAQILTVQVQHGEPQLWAIVDPSRGTERRAFRIFGTGHPVDCAESLRYIATFQTASGRLVWHMFECVK